MVDSDNEEFVTPREVDDHGEREERIRQTREEKRLEQEEANREAEGPQDMPDPEDDDKGVV